MILLKKDFIFDNVDKLKGVGKQLSKYLKKKKIEKVKDILLNFETKMITKNLHYLKLKIGALK